MRHDRSNDVTISGGVHVHVRQFVRLFSVAEAMFLCLETEMYDDGLLQFSHITFRQCVSYEWIASPPLPLLPTPYSLLFFTTGLFTKYSVVLQIEFYFSL